MWKKRQQRQSTKHIKKSYFTENPRLLNQFMRIIGPRIGKLAPSRRENLVADHIHPFLRERKNAEFKRGNAGFQQRNVVVV